VLAIHTYVHFQDLFLMDNFFFNVPFFFLSLSFVLVLLHLLFCILITVCICSRQACQPRFRTADTRPINFLDCGYILGQFVRNRHNLLYQTWADRPGVYTYTLYLKCK